MLKLRWNTLHKQTREEILLNACIQERFQHYEWEEIDDWLKALIIENMELRSKGTVTII